MKKLRNLSFIYLAISLAGFIFWRFITPMPDIFVRIDGIFMLIAIILSTFTTVRLKMSDNK